MAFSKLIKDKHIGKQMSQVQLTEFKQCRIIELNVCHFVKGVFEIGVSKYPANFYRRNVG